MRVLSRFIGRAFVATWIVAARAAVAQQIPPSVEFQVPKTPTIAVSDSGSFIVYELHVTNLTAAPMTLHRVEVFDADKRANIVANLADSGLFRAVARPAPATPVADRTTMAGGTRVYVYLWIPVDRNTAPTRLTHRLTLQRVGADSSPVVLEGTTIPVERDAIVIAPPVRGEWAAFNGPSNSSGHRRLVLALDGHVASGQRFAIDYLQVDSAGSSRHGDPAKNTSYYAYGTELLAVADGIVVATKDGIPENVPGANSRAVPITLETVGGNFVGIEVAKGRYALYAHVQPNSLRVKIGDHVKRGQVIALLGNSGNSTEPHVHFQIADGPTFLSSEGLPYALESFDVVGRCGIDNGPPPSIKCSRAAAVNVKHGMPLQNELVRFPK
jgi:murein DD-endopeptidase MepM/ murein hydrolase activator NlpD